MWELVYKESWVLKNWCFWTVVLEKTLESPWTARSYNQSILKEISPGCSLEGLMLKLKLQYFGHFMRRVDSLEKTLMLGGIGGRKRRGDRGWDGWMASPTLWTWVWVRAPGVANRQRSLVCCSPWVCRELDTTEWLNWTELLSGIWSIILEVKELKSSFVNEFD